MKRLAWFSAGLAAFLASSLGLAQVGAPIAGASGPPSGTYTQAQQVTSAQALKTPYIVCKTAVAATAPADTTEDTLATCTIPAGVLAPNGRIELRTEFSFSSSAGTKTVRVRYSGGAGTDLTGAAVVTTHTQGAFLIYVANRNATNSQKYHSDFTFGNGNPANANALFINGGTLAIDTTASTSFVITCQKNTAGDTCTNESLQAILYSDGT